MSDSHWWMTMNGWMTDEVMIDWWMTDGWLMKWWMTDEWITDGCMTDHWTRNMMPTRCIRKILRGCRYWASQTKVMGGPLTWSTAHGSYFCFKVHFCTQIGCLWPYDWYTGILLGPTRELGPKDTTRLWLEESERALCSLTVHAPRGKSLHLLVVMSIRPLRESWTHTKGDKQTSWVGNKTVKRRTDTSTKMLFLQQSRKYEIS